MDVSRDADSAAYRMALGQVMARLKNGGVRTRLTLSGAIMVWESAALEADRIARLDEGGYDVLDANTGRLKDRVSGQVWNNAEKTYER